MLVSFLLHWQALYIYVYLGNITVDVAIITEKIFSKLLQQLLILMRQRSDSYQRY